MSLLSPEVEALRNEALCTATADWAVREGWSLKRNGPNLTGPCPRCGGTDRFSIDAPSGKWNCRGCCVGGHDVISLVRHIEVLKFVPALERITGRRATDKVDRQAAAETARQAQARAQAQERKTAAYREQSRRDARSLWKRLPPADGHVAAYFEKRGLKTDLAPLAKVLREAADLEYWHDGKAIHSGPAMVAAIQFSDGRFAGVHRTWLDAGTDNGRLTLFDPGKTDEKTGEPMQLKTKKTMGTKGDGAIRLIDRSGGSRLVIGEGIETTLTPYVLSMQPGTAYWAGIDLGHIAGRALRDSDGKTVAEQPDMDDDRCFKIPDAMTGQIKELILLGDGDSDCAKTRAAMTRAARRQKRLNPDLTVKTAWPDIKGDFNDMVDHD